MSSLICCRHRLAEPGGFVPLRSRVRVSHHCLALHPSIKYNLPCLATLSTAFAVLALCAGTAPTPHKSFTKQHAQLGHCVYMFLPSSDVPVRCSVLILKYFRALGGIRTPPFIIQDGFFTYFFSHCTPCCIESRTAAVFRLNSILLKNHFKRRIVSLF